MQEAAQRLDLQREERLELLLGAAAQALLAALDLHREAAQGRGQHRQHLARLLLPDALLGELGQVVERLDVVPGAEREDAQAGGAVGHLVDRGAVEPELAAGRDGRRRAAGRHGVGGRLGRRVGCRGRWPGRSGLGLAGESMRSSAWSDRRLGAAGHLVDHGARRSTTRVRSRSSSGVGPLQRAFGGVAELGERRPGAACGRRP